MPQTLRVLFSSVDLAGYGSQDASSSMTFAARILLAACSSAFVTGFVDRTS